MAELEVLNPVAHVSIRRVLLAPQLKSLEGKRVGLYWNAHQGGDIALARVSQLLESKFKGMSFRLIKSSVTGPKEKVEEAKTFDAVIGATAD